MLEFVFRKILFVVYLLLSVASLAFLIISL